MFIGVRQYVVMVLPGWLKILIVLGLSSLVISALGAVSQYLVPAFLMAALIIFPGSDQDNPRLIKWLPVLWGLSFAVAITSGNAPVADLEIVWVAVDPVTRQPVNVPQTVRDWLKSFLA